MTPDLDMESIESITALGALHARLGGDASTYSDVFDAIGVHPRMPYGAASDVPTAFAAMKGNAVDEIGQLSTPGINCRKVVFRGGSDATVHPDNAKRILEQVRRGADRLEQIDLD